ncbi:hypothetical protein ACFQ6N_33050 [Kitasatospora sp. NPDC056446]|uniref:DUF3885 domain-containing protein n=1 Tax=Kitasatospora sp. NPDC056446 TaxID=3345819 RepID=UPI0036945F93
MDRDALTALWERRWPGSMPIGHEIQERGGERWVRFHSLPESKRYPDDEREYAILLERHNTVLNGLFTGKEVYVLTPRWTEKPSVPRMRRDAKHWRTWFEPDEPDGADGADGSEPECGTYWHSFVERQQWRPGCLDRLLRRVADEREYGVIVSDTGMRRLYHPYDGGADVYLTTTEERDRLKERHADWLSRYPGGW